MSIQVSCACGRTFKVKDTMAGKRGRCPFCGGSLAIPTPQSTPHKAADEDLAFSVLNEPTEYERAVAGAAPVLEPLIKALRREDDHMSCFDVKEKLERIKPGWTTSAEAITMLPSLAAALKNPKRKIRMVVIGMLHGIKDRRAVDLLIGMLQDKNLFVRAIAAESLAQSEDQRAVAPIAGLLKIEGRGDGCVWMRIQAVKALGWLGGRQAFDALVGALNDSHPTVQSSAVLALAQIGSPEAIRVIKGMHTPNEETKRAKSIVMERLEPSPKQATASRGVKRLVVFLSVKKPEDERWYLRQVCDAIGGMDQFENARIDAEYVRVDQLNEDFLIGYATESGFDVNACTMTPFTDRNGGKGMALKVLG